MKTIKIIIILLIFTNFNIYAQQNNSLKRVSIAEIGKVTADKSVHVYDDNLDKFIGTWVGKKDGKSVRFKFIKKTFLLSKDPANHSEMELITGTLQLLNNQNVIISYTNDEISASSHSNDSLDVFIDVKARKTQAALLVSFLRNGTIKLETQNNIFESKNDKDFEFQGSMILTKQN